MSLKNGTAAIILSLGLLFVTGGLEGQDIQHTFYHQSLRINNAGMVVLGSWALANITLGAYGWNRYDGQRAYFHQMNLFWNTVNLAIAGIALYSNVTADYLGWGTEDILDRQMKTQRLFLINAGLDVVYMGTGLLLKHIAHRYPGKEERLAGYGNSVMLQGAFLFLFDLVLYGIQRSHRMDFLETLSLHPLQGGLGVSVALNL